MAERTVFIYLPGQTQAVPAGRLTLVEEGTQVVASRFEYGRRYAARANALPIDPVSLPLAAIDNNTPLVPANGLNLFGAIRDATPDAWGRRVIENKLRAPPNSLLESTYLDHAGPYRAGALDIRESPDSEPVPSALPAAMDLQHLLEAAANIEQGTPVPAHLENFFTGGPTVGGARPKAVLTHEASEWIAKFPASGDAIDMPRVEYATLSLAREAGLQVPRTRIMSLAGGRDVMLIERFDRQVLDGGAIARHHMVSALTMLGKNEMESPRSSYAEIAHAIDTHGSRGSIAADRAELFARMIFNITVSNDDDHLRNHAFVHHADRRGWRLSPLYDVVPRASVALERTLHLAVGPRGRVATLDNALDGAGQFGLLPADAARIIDRVARVVRQWRECFDKAGVSARDCERVAPAFRRFEDIGGGYVERHL